MSAHSTENASLTNGNAPGTQFRGHSGGGIDGATHEGAATDTCQPRVGARCKSQAKATASDYVDRAISVGDGHASGRCTGHASM